MPGPGMVSGTAAAAAEPASGEEEEKEEKEEEVKEHSGGGLSTGFPPAGAKLLVSCPVIVSAVEFAGPSVEDDALVETVAVGALWVIEPPETKEEDVSGAEEAACSKAALAECIVGVGLGWAFPLRPGTQIRQDGFTFLVPARCAGTSFAMSLAPNTPSQELASWLALLLTRGCVLEEGCAPKQAVGGAFLLGQEYDATSADEVIFEGVPVAKGSWATSTVELDSRGYFYWLNGKSRKLERTRPRWRETNCVTCRRVATGRRIVWECYNVPTRGEAPAESRVAIIAMREEAAKANEELWASRQLRAGQAATVSLKAVGIAAQVAAPCVRFAAHTAAAALEFGGEVAKEVVPAAEQPIKVDPQVRGAVTAFRSASEMGAAGCEATAEALQSGAVQVGRKLSRHLPKNSSAAAAEEEEEEAAEPEKIKVVKEELGQAAKEAVAELGKVFEEITTARGMIRRSATSATCSVVGARYGNDAGDTLKEAFGAVGAAKSFHHGSRALTKFNVAQTVAVHGTLGVVGGPGPHGDAIEDAEASAGDGVLLGTASPARALSAPAEVGVAIQETATPIAAA